MNKEVALLFCKVRREGDGSSHGCPRFVFAAEDLAPDGVCAHCKEDAEAVEGLLSEKRDER